MPPDTTHIPGPFIFPAPPSHLADSLRKQALPKLATQSDGPHLLLPEWQLLIIILLILLLLYFFHTRVARIASRLRENTWRKNAQSLLSEKRNQYAEWFTKYNPYYNTLSKEHQDRFLFRVAEFMQSKSFEYHSIRYEEQIPLLISGAAVQVTFGLKNYLMDYFSVIHVMGSEYVLKFDNDTYFGHVSKSGIHVAWNHFLKGYADYHDSVNVGIHEMAHAVSYDVFLGQEDHADREFKQRLEDFSATGITVFRALRKGASHVLDDYGATNFDEFWAVCIETFFENPEEFKRTEPDMYLSICELLNQDPLSHNKIIDPVIAGIEP